MRPFRGTSPLARKAAARYGMPMLTVRTSLASLVSLAILGLAAASPAACGNSESALIGDDAGSSHTSLPDGSNAPTTDGATGSDSSGPGRPDSTNATIKTVFVIVMENHSLSTIKASAAATYINGTLLAESAHATAYSTPPGLHPSEPNYIWMEAGDNLGIKDDSDPSKNHRAEKDHLVTQLEAAGISWKVYAEAIPDATKCNLVSSPAIGNGKYGVKHIPQLFFDDVTDTNSATSKRCIDHVRPFAELDGDLADPAKTPRYAFIVPDLCNDMHGIVGLDCPSTINPAALIKRGDDFLATTVPKITASKAFTDSGVLFIAWDEGDEALGGKASDGPIPFFALSPFVKKGYAMTKKVDHSAYLRTVQTIFGVPLLRGAQTAPDFAEMFTSFP